MTAPAAAGAAPGGGTVYLVGGAAQARALLDDLFPGRRRVALASITAGAQEFEGDAGLGLTQPVTDLALHARAEALFDALPELRAAHAQRQSRMQTLERYYRRRLEHAADAALALLQEPVADEALRAHRAGAIRALRALDREHMRQVQQVHVRFDASLPAQVQVELARARTALAGEVARYTAVVVAGGHVAVLLNRLQMFALAEPLRAAAVIAWGAGAMACTAQVLLFHDRAPTGARTPELLGPGLGLAPGLFALPQARARLELGEPARLAVLARRLAPARLLLLDEGTCVCAAPAQRALASAHVLSAGGRVTRMRGR